MVLCQSNQCNIKSILNRKLVWGRTSHLPKKQALTSEENENAGKPLMSQKNYSVHVQRKTTQTHYTGMVCTFTFTVMHIYTGLLLLNLGEKMMEVGLNGGEGGLSAPKRQSLGFVCVSKPDVVTAKLLGVCHCHACLTHLFCLLFSSLPQSNKKGLVAWQV